MSNEKPGWSADHSIIPEVSHSAKNVGCIGFLSRTCHVLHGLFMYLHSIHDEFQSLSVYFKLPQGLCWRDIYSLKVNYWKSSCMHTCGYSFKEELFWKTLLCFINLYKMCFRKEWQQNMKLFLFCLPQVNYFTSRCVTVIWQLLGLLYRAGQSFGWECRRKVYEMLLMELSSLLLNLCFSLLKQTLNLMVRNHLLFPLLALANCHAYFTKNKMRFDVYE